MFESITTKNRFDGFGIADTVAQTIQFDLTTVVDLASAAQHRRFRQQSRHSMLQTDLQIPVIRSWLFPRKLTIGDRPVAVGLV
jgi:hypothetical protein